MATTGAVLWQFPPKGYLAASDFGDPDDSFCWRPKRAPMMLSISDDLAEYLSKENLRAVRQALERPARG